MGNDRGLGTKTSAVMKHIAKATKKADETHPPYCHQIAYPQSSPCGRHLSRWLSKARSSQLEKGKAYWARSGR